MDSFGTWRKWKLILFLMQNFIVLYELLMPCFNSSLRNASIFRKWLLVIMLFWLSTDDMHMQWYMYDLQVPWNGWPGMNSLALIRSFMLYLLAMPWLESPPGPTLFCRVVNWLSISHPLVETGTGDEDPPFWSLVGATWKNLRMRSFIKRDRCLQLPTIYEYRGVIDYLFTIRVFHR